MKSISLFFKHQISYLTFLFILFVAPLALFFEFSTYALPKVQYVFLIVLLVSQYLFYNEKSFRKKIEANVTLILKKELNRVPSRKEIHARSTIVIQYRGVCIIISAISILLLMIFHKEF
jgi:hypothetical protein